MQKKFLFLQKKFFVTVLFFISVVAAFVVLSFRTKQVQAGARHNVSGWAWSANIGWVSFNSTNTNVPSGVDYGVNIDDNGVFSGYAWSSSVGWLSFNEADLSGCPSSPCNARVDSSTGNVSGWAKPLSLSGWMKLRGNNYGVSIDKVSGRFQGWAWASEPIGWLNFSGANYRVETIFKFNNPPSIANLFVEGRDYCTTPCQHFSWNFQDPDAGDGQSAYQIQVDKEGNFLAFGPGEFDSGKVESASQAKLVLVASTPAVGQLGYNTRYYWRVRVWDKKDVASNWVQGPLFSTPLHRYPSPNFQWSPSAPAKDEVVQLCATSTGACSRFAQEELSTCYGARYPSCSGQTFRWTFDKSVGFVSGSSASSENPQVKFKESGSQRVTLQITDTAGTCSITKSLGVALPLPEWQEVEP